MHYNDELKLRKFVKKSELKQYLLLGWKIGIPKSAHKKIKNQRWVYSNKLKVSRRIKTRELKQYLAKGWKRGYKKF